MKHWHDSISVGIEGALHSIYIYSNTSCSIIAHAIVVHIKLTVLRSPQAGIWESLSILKVRNTTIQPSNTNPLTQSAMIMAFIYSWSQRERGNSTKFMYMIDIPCVALPYALLLVTLVSKGWYKTLVESMGILAAHLYNFLTVIYPVYGGGRNYLAVPAFVEKWFTRGDGANRSYGTPFRPSETPRSEGTTGWTSGSIWGGSDNNWKGRGTGRRLGS